MEIRLYYNTSDNRTIRKKLINEYAISGTLRESCSLLEPVLTIQHNDVIRYNYAYIPEFQRYYFINKVTSMRKNLWTIELEVDPLMSFKADILALSVVIDKQSSPSIGDEYIDDGSLVTDNYTFKSIYNFASGFNDHGEYILITAG